MRRSWIAGGCVALCLVMQMVPASSPGEARGNVHDRERAEEEYRRAGENEAGHAQDGVRPSVRRPEASFLWRSR